MPQLDVGMSTIQFGSPLLLANSSELSAMDEPASDMMEGVDNLPLEVPGTWCEREIADEMMEVVSEEGSDGENDADDDEDDSPEWAWENFDNQSDERRPPNDEILLAVGEMDDHEPEDTRITLSSEVLPSYQPVAVSSTGQAPPERRLRRRTPVERTTTRSFLSQKRNTDPNDEGSYDGSDEDSINAHRARIVPRESRSL
ncbi:hypothetical protein FRC17_010139 [Serendipita sp. 399]|nr:hypothetical protein FRC17_010139 [Serendipita sp. 399]